MTASQASGIRHQAPLDLRPMTLRDIPAVSALAEKIWRACYAEIIPGDQIDYMLNWMYSAESLREQIEKQGHAFTLAWLGEALAGYLSASEEGKGEYAVHKFYVDHTRHRQGIGKRLLENLIAQKQPSLLRLYVNRNNIPAINFYFRHGFTIEAISDKDIGGGFWMRDFVMARKW